MSERQPQYDGEDGRSLRVGRILNDFLDARARGEVISNEQLLAQHPDLADELREHLELLGQLRPAGDRVETLIAQGLLTRSCDPRYLAELGAYKILELSGRGGMGVVFKAYEESLSRTVALKILRPEFADDQAALGRFTREAKAAGTLRHPNIVTIHAIGEQKGVHYIAMEYVGGPSLAEVIKQQRSASAAAGPRTGCTSLSTETIRHVFRQLLSALAAAHEAGLIHRDVKSSNILLDEGVKGPRSPGAEGSAEAQAESMRGAESAVGNLQSATPEPRTLNPEPSFLVKLADFGLARVLSSQTRMTVADSILGTPEYMSPEQARGDQDIDHRTDLYSAGVVLYEMLTGRTPFKADTPTAIIHQILHADPPDPRTLGKDIDPNLASLALRLLAKSPADRFASAGEALAALHAGERLCKPRRRQPFSQRRGFQLACGAAILVLLAAIGWWLITMFGLRPTKIYEVQLQPGLPNVVGAFYEDGSDWKTFYKFPKGIELADTEVLDADEYGSQVIVVASREPLGAGNVLVALDANKHELWGLRFCQDFDWPDDDCPTECWQGHLLAKGDLDGRPGEEAVVVAQHPEQYPTRISVVDPRTGAIRSTFWHMGQIEGILLIESFFEDGRPAIVAWGVNNKLDGFDDNQIEDGDATSATRWDLVAVVMILDPQNMNGLGPPLTKRVPIPPAPLHAYAFIDLAQSASAKRRLEGAAERIAPKPEEIAKIASVSAIDESTPDGTRLCFQVAVARPGVPGGAYLRLGRALDIQHMTPHSGEKANHDLDYWKDPEEGVWRLIIQDGGYVNK